MKLNSMRFGQKMLKDASVLAKKQMCHAFALAKTHQCHGQEAYDVSYLTWYHTHMCPSQGTYMFWAKVLARHINDLAGHRYVVDKTYNYESWRRSSVDRQPKSTGTPLEHEL